jgi:hypothetical protein
MSIGKGGSGMGTTAGSGKTPTDKLSGKEQTTRTGSNPGSKATGGQRVPKAPVPRSSKK